VLDVEVAVYDELGSRPKFALEEQRDDPVVTDGVLKETDQPVCECMLGEVALVIAVFNVVPTPVFAGVPLIILPWYAAFPVSEVQPLGHDERK